MRRTPSDKTDTTECQRCKRGVATRTCAAHARQNRSLTGTLTCASPRRSSPVLPSKTARVLQMVLSLRSGSPRLDPGTCSTSFWLACGELDADSATDGVVSAKGWAGVDQAWASSITCRRVRASCGPSSTEFEVRPAKVCGGQLRPTIGRVDQTRARPHLGGAPKRLRCRSAA